MGAAPAKRTFDATTETAYQKWLSDAGGEDNAQARENYMSSKSRGEYDASGGEAGFMSAKGQIANNETPTVRAEVTPVAPNANPAPPMAPDLTDEALKKVRRAQALSLLTKRGRRSTFLTEAGGTYASGAKPGSLFGLGIGSRVGVSGMGGARNPTLLGGR